MSETPEPVDLTKVAIEDLRAEIRRRLGDADVVVSWSGTQHFMDPGGRVLNDGSAQALCSPSTFGKPLNTDGVVMWGTRRGRNGADMPMCKSCVRRAPVHSPTPAP